MTFYQKDGKRGLLAKGELGNASDNVPEYDVEAINDGRLLSALFRDYTFWASAYLLEPCHLNLLQEGKYGLGRNRLPRNIARPLMHVSRQLGMRPFMEYATSYALYNYRGSPRSYEKLRLIRSFTGMPSEAGFILSHVTMDAFTGKLVDYTQRALQAAMLTDRRRMALALSGLHRTLSLINAEMEQMWSRSRPNDYKEFRTFIMGIKSQPMFPRGVIYEGVSDEPQAYRGESGANDSIIPTCDNLLQIYQEMPKNPLTDILTDFRTYRPPSHNEWLWEVERKARQYDVRQFCLSTPKLTVLYLMNLDQVRDFRQRHWNFTKEYIIKQTDHPVATGGSPIVTWLPNQLAAVLKIMNETVAAIDGDKLTDPHLALQFRLITNRMNSQEHILEHEVGELQRKFPRDPQEPKH